MTTRKQLRGQIQTPSGRPQNVVFTATDDVGISPPTILSNTGTPSVIGNSLFITGGTTPITNFLGGERGQTITILADHNVTITHTADVIELAEGNDYVMTAGDTLTLVQFNQGIWYEISRLDTTTGGAPADGRNNATVYAYKRSASAPTDNPGTVVYTFASPDGWTPGNSWSIAPPSGSDPLYVVAAFATSTSATDTIDAAEWSSPVELGGVDGADGADGAAGVDGLNTATVYLYQRTASGTPPAAPTTASATYTFATGVLDAVNNGWTQSIPDTADQYLWVTFAVAISNTATDEIEDSEWAQPERLAQDGDDGPQGPSGSDAFNAAFLTAYKKSPTQPADDPGAVTYTFATGAWTPANGWNREVPSSGSDPLWTVQASAVGQGATDNIAASEWSDPALVSQSGEDGVNTAVIYIYQRATTTPTLPSAQTSYTFSTGVLTGLNNGWTTTPPALATGINLWISFAVASSNNATDTIESSEWASAEILSEGVYNQATLLAYKRSASTPTDDPGTVVYTFASNFYTPGNGWSASIPAGSDPLYVVAAAARSQGATDTVQDTEWSSPVLFAQDGGDGLNTATVYLYQRSSNATTGPTLPSTSETYTFSTGALSTPNNGWSQTLPATGDQYLWFTFATASSVGATDTILSSEWAAAARLAADGDDGATGADAVSASLTNAAVVVSADSAGGNYDLTGTGGTFEITQGVTDVSGSTTFTVVGSSTVNGLTIGITSGGVYSLSGTSWSSDQESFTLRATYNAVNYDRVYSIAKVKSTALQPANVRNATIDDTDASSATVSYSLTSGGKEQRIEGGITVSSLDWLNSGQPGDYQARLVNTGGTNSPTGASLNTWLALSSTRTWTLTRSTGGFINSVNTIEIRNATTQTVIDSATITLIAEVIA